MTVIKAFLRIGLSGIRAGITLITPLTTGILFE